MKLSLGRVIVICIPICIPTERENIRKMFMQWLACMIYKLFKQYLFSFDFCVLLLLIYLILLSNLSFYSFHDVFFTTIPIVFFIIIFFGIFLMVIFIFSYLWYFCINTFGFLLIQTLFNFCDIFLLHLLWVFTIKTKALLIFNYFYALIFS